MTETTESTSEKSYAERLKELELKAKELELRERALALAEKERANTEASQQNEEEAQTTPIGTCVRKGTSFFETTGKILVKFFAGWVGAGFCGAIVSVIQIALTQGINFFLTGIAIIIGFGSGWCLMNRVMGRFFDKRN